MSWFSRLFGSSKNEPTCLDIVSDYGDALQSARRSISGLCDVRDLPHQKELIKQALLEAANLNLENAKQLDALGSAFVMLGNFQAISTSAADRPDPEKLKSMNEAEFMDYIKSKKGPDEAESAVRKLALAESKALMSEWQEHLRSLGI